MNKQKLDFA